MMVKENKIKINCGDYNNKDNYDKVNGDKYNNKNNLLIKNLIN